MELRLPGRERAEVIVKPAFLAFVPVNCVGPHVPVFTGESGFVPVCLTIEACLCVLCSISTAFAISLLT